MTNSNDKFRAITNCNLRVVGASSLAVTEHTARHTVANILNYWHSEMLSIGREKHIIEGYVICEQQRVI